MLFMISTALQGQFTRPWVMTEDNHKITNTSYYTISIEVDEEEKIFKIMDRSYSSDIEEYHIQLKTIHKHDVYEIKIYEDYIIVEQGNNVVYEQQFTPVVQIDRFEYDGDTTFIVSHHVLNHRKYDFVQDRTNNFLRKGDYFNLYNFDRVIYID